MEPIYTTHGNEEAMHTYDAPLTESAPATQPSIMLSYSSIDEHKRTAHNGYHFRQSGEDEECTYEEPVTSRHGSFVKTLVGRGGGLYNKDRGRKGTKERK